MTIRGRRGQGGRGCPPYMGLKLGRECRATIRGRRGQGGQGCPPYMPLRLGRECRSTVRGRRGQGGRGCPPYMGLRIGRECRATIRGRRGQGGQGCPPYRFLIIRYLNFGYGRVTPRVLGRPGRPSVPMLGTKSLSLCRDALRRVRGPGGAGQYTSLTKPQ